MKKLLRLFLMLVMCLMMAGAWKTEAYAANIVSTNHQKYSYSEYRKDLRQLRKKYSDRMQVNIIGQSADERNIYEVVLGNPEAKRHLLVIGNLHAREYMTIQLCMAQIESYMKRYNKKEGGKKIADVLDKVAIHYIPSANPDGTAISQYGFNAIRNKKLRSALKKMPGSSRTWKANARGVDLNRNWAIAFRKAGRRGSAGFHGNKAASEPEIKALVKWINRIDKSGKICGVVSYHSTGSILYGRCASQTKATVKKNTTRMYKVAQKLTGYRLMPTESIRYANGCSREYFLYKRNIPCITVEVGRNSCPLKSGEFPSIWRKNKNLVIREAMLFD